MSDSSHSRSWYQKLSGEEKREYLDSLKQKRRKIKRRAEKLCMKECYFCGYDEKLLFHRKDGKKHPTSNTPKLVLKDPSKWACLCYRCHKAVHWCMNFLGMEWEDIAKMHHDNKERRG